MEERTTEAAHHFKLRDFEGPLDLLLFLIKKSEINIYDIPISQITEQYLQYLEYSTRVDLENITEFYVLAATLLYIKSRMLLPVEINLDDELDDPRKELVDKLIEYQKFKKLSELMEDKEKEAEWIIERRKKQRSLPFVEDELWEQIEVWDLFRTFNDLMSGLAPEKILDMYEEVSVNEKITLIYEYLETRSEFLFTDLVLNPSSVMEVVCAFLAVLEAVKQRRVRIFQNRLFGDIQIRTAERGRDELER
ncbi:MAG: segregation/condensation protein A [Spirochaetaceae bacterium]|nr:MAG: segregation/condensation protein A [Spirochaetaceae bacterium]